MAATAMDASADPSQRRFRGCSKITDYEITGKLGEGTFGVVSKGLSKRTGAVVALKKILMHNEKDGFPITALREIKLLKMLSHPNIVKLEEMAVERNKSEGKKRAIMYMITPYMDHDLSGMTTNPDIQFTIPQIKCYMHQLLEGLRYLHDSSILHRDMKAANILISNRGILQIADFGLARHYEGPKPRPGHGNGDAVRDYTTLVVTRWYRPPELLLQLRRYTPAIDMWGAGCVFAELFERRPILEGKTDINQAEIIFELIGSPNEDNMPGWQALPGCEGVRQWAQKKGNIVSRFHKRLGDDGLSLLQQMLTLDWRKRINAHDALKHPYFSAKPLPARPEDIPRFEDSHELDRRKHHEKRAALPPAPAGGTVGMGPDEWAPQGEYGAYYDRRHNGPRDRPPPGQPAPPARGPPQNNIVRHDERDRDRGGPPSYRGHRDRDEKRPAWQRPGTDNGARGPLPVAYNGESRNGSAEPDRRFSSSNAPPGPGRNDVDTYIPNYNDNSGRAPRRDDHYRDRDAPPPRNRDVPPPGRDRDRDRDVRDHGRDRDRPGPDREARPQRDERIRSRSPWRGRTHDARDRDGAVGAGPGGGGGGGGRDMRDRGADRDTRPPREGGGDRDNFRDRDRDNRRGGDVDGRERRARLQERERERYRM